MNFTGLSILLSVKYISEQLFSLFSNNNRSRATNKMKMKTTQELQHFASFLVRESSVRQLLQLPFNFQSRWDGPSRVPWPIWGSFFICRVQRSPLSLGCRLTPAAAAPTSPPTHTHIHIRRHTYIMLLHSFLSLARTFCFLLLLLLLCAKQKENNFHACMRKIKGKHTYAHTQTHRERERLRQTTMPICVIRKRAAHQLKTISKCCRRAQVTWKASTGRRP